jgi:menaquinol-cytochrome c reductase iron-sulfur subunit
MRKSARRNIILETRPHAQSYADPGTPEEQSRRTFLANATLGIGGVIGLVLAIPTAISLVPESLIKGETTGGTWSPLTADEFKSLQAATENPIKLDIRFTAQDGYLKTDVEQFVWGLKLSPAEVADFKAKRPDLYKRAGGAIKYNAITMSFIIYSPICPHLGCYYQWQAGLKKFVCPCHGSVFSELGAWEAGPAPRGLDPLPFREADGKAEVTWIRYQTQQADRIIVDYT